MVGAWSYVRPYTIEANGTSGDPVAPPPPPRAVNTRRPAFECLVRRLREAMKGRPAARKGPDARRRPQPHAKRTACTLSVQLRPPTKQMGLFQPAAAG